MNHYEVIILGGELSGLVSGALLAKRGYRVLMIGHDTVSNTYKSGGLILHHLPFLLPGHDGLPAMAKVFDDLALTQVVRARVEKPPLLGQLVIPKHRLDFLPDKGEMVAELGREFPSQKEEFRAFVEQLDEVNGSLNGLLDGSMVIPAHTIREKLALRRTAALLPSLSASLPWSRLSDPTHPLHLLAQAHLRFSSHLLQDQPSSLQLIRLLSPLRTGLSGILGGLDGMRELLGEGIARQGGALMPSCRAQEVMMKGSRATGVILADTEERFGCDILLANTRASSIQQLIPEPFHKRRLTAELSSLVPRFNLFAMNIVIAREAHPPGMGQLVYVIRDPQRPLVEENLLRLVCSNPTEDKEIIHVTCLVPSQALVSGGEALDNLKERLLDSLTWLMPFFRRHLIEVDCPWEEGTRGAKYRIRKAFDMAPLYETDLPRSLGVSALPAVTPYKNILMTGHQVLPGLGLEGEFLTGLVVAGLVSRMATKKNLLSS